MFSMNLFSSGRRMLLLNLSLWAVLAAAPLANAQSTVDDVIAQASTAINKGKPKDALTLLNKAIDESPNNADLYALRARANDATGRFPAALNDANKYVELMPEDAFGYLSRAKIYMSLEKMKEALDDASKAISLAPNEPDGYYRRADIYNDMGNKSAATADEQKAEQLEKKSN